MAPVVQKLKIIEAGLVQRGFTAGQVPKLHPHQIPWPPKPAGTEGEYTGTSFAAPIVSGAVAIVRQASALLVNLTDPAALSEPEEARGRGLLDMTRGP